MKWFSVLVLTCAFLTTSAIAEKPPEVGTDKTVWPDEIFLEGTGVPDEAEITLAVNGTGDSILSSPIDLMIAIDVSGSMGGLPLADAQALAVYICQYLEHPFTQSGLISFNADAELLRGLSFDHPGLIPYIQGLVAFGATAMGDAINLAQTELTGANHRAGNLPVILIISDGSSNRGADPIAAGGNAKAAGTLVRAAGIGSPVKEQILRTVVSEPDTENYWHYPPPDKYQEIVEALHGLPSFLAARQLTIVERLDFRFDYVPGSFSIVPDTIAGRYTGWDIGELDIGETWYVSFRVTASDTGLLPVEQLPASRANYMNFAGGWVNVPFPQGYVHVVMGTGIEEGFVSTRDETAILTLGPNPFHESCTISYPADGHSRVKVTIHDLVGRVTKTLVDGVPTAGMHDVVWRGHNQQGQSIASGAYVCRYESGDITRSRVVLLVR